MRAQHYVLYVIAYVRLIAGGIGYHGRETVEIIKKIPAGRAELPLARGYAAGYAARKPVKLVYGRAAGIIEQRRSGKRNHRRGKHRPPPPFVVAQPLYTAPNIYATWFVRTRGRIDFMRRKCRRTIIDNTRKTAAILYMIYLHKKTMSARCVICLHKVRCIITYTKKQCLFSDWLFCQPCSCGAAALNVSPKVIALFTISVYCCSVSGGDSVTFTVT